MVFIDILIGILIPFIGTTLGAGLVIFLKNQIPNVVERFLIGFAAGVMMAASVFSLLLPSIESSTTFFRWIPAAIGFLIGVGALVLLDHLLPRVDFEKNEKDYNFQKTMMFVLAVTLHNIPEGMAVGVIFAALLNGSEVSLTAAFALSVGIAIQNFPEGAIISLPLKSLGYSKSKSFFYGMLSGIVEPIAAVITILLTKLVVPILPYFLSFAAGAMIYVVVEELIPECHSRKESSVGAIGVALGFVVMMILDVALG